MGATNRSITVKPWQFYSNKSEFMLQSIGAPKKRKTVEEQQLRIIEIKLFPPTPRHYPRFDYEEMWKEMGLDTDEERKDANEKNEFRDQDAEEIVRRLEKKYGTQTISMQATSKKAKKHKKTALKFAPEDIMDKGLGYDLEDEFIDDRIAYDEWVPTTMDTAKRGHYVNKGPLEFRQVDLDATTSGSSSADDEEEGSHNSGGEAASIFCEEDDDNNLMEIETEEPTAENKNLGEATGADGSKKEGNGNNDEKPKTNVEPAVENDSGSEIVILEDSSEQPAISKSIKETKTG